MNEIALILKNNKYSFREEKEKFYFLECPICKTKEHESISCLDPGHNFFICNACEQNGMAMTELFKKLSIPYDSSPTDFATLAFNDLDETFSPDRVNGIKTGYSTLDNKTGGIKSGHLYIIAAETGVGKSVFAVNLLLNVLRKADKSVSYFDLENGKFANYTRFSMIEGKKTPAFFQNRENKGKYLEIIQKFAGKVTYRGHEKLQPFTTQNNTGMAESIAELIRFDAKEDRKVFVIDPLENFETSDTNYNAIAKVIILFKDLAQELGISIIILHHIKKPQMSRDNLVNSLTPEEIKPTKYRIPTLHDFIGSSKITNIATDVWVLVRQKDAVTPNEQGRMLLRILKQRESSNGGDVYLSMDMATLRINELEVTHLVDQPYYNKD